MSILKFFEKEIDRIETKYRYEKTFNGYDFDISKSALQKYIRRSDFVKATYFAIELSLFGYKSLLKGDSKACFTNFINRLKVIMLEDIGISNSNLFIFLDKLLNEYTQDIDKNSHFLPYIIKIMCFSNHCRLFSLLRVYPENKTDIENKNNTEEIKQNLSFSTDFPKHEKLIKDFIKKLEAKEITIIHSINRIINSEKLETKVFKSNNPSFLVFHIFKEFIKYKKVSKTLPLILNICIEWYKKLKVKENVLCVYFPIYTYILNCRTKKYNIFDEIPRSFNVFYYINLKNKVDLDSYVVDLHTKKGRLLGMNKSNFSVEGSLVSYDCLSYFIKNYINLIENYINTKNMNQDIENESDILKLKVRVQLTCSKIRPCVYSAKTDNDENVIVKGPYLNYQDCIFPFSVFQIMKLFKNVNHIKSNIKLLKINKNIKVPFGSRNNITNENGYFLVMEDLFNIENYPIEIKSSKLWKNEAVIDFKKLFENSEFNIAIPSKITEKANISLIYQLAFRYIFEIGDFASRNFLVIREKAYNVDVEGIFISKTLKWAKKEKEHIYSIYQKYKDEIIETFTYWKNQNEDFIDKFIIIRKTLNLNGQQITRIKENLEHVIDNFDKWLLE
jgi:hypothetical protein